MRHLTKLRVAVWTVPVRMAGAYGVLRHGWTALPPVPARPPATGSPDAASSMYFVEATGDVVILSLADGEDVQVCVPDDNPCDVTDDRVREIVHRAVLSLGVLEKPVSAA